MTYQEAALVFLIIGGSAGFGAGAAGVFYALDRWRMQFRD